jgi:ABC-type nitrate/sulfonate/bicarbonate transport system permease component
MSEHRLLPRLQLPGQRKPDDSLKLLAGAGATPRQMLWGLWWCHTLPSLFKSLAAVGCAGFVARLVGAAIGLLTGMHTGDA